MEAGGQHFRGFRRGLDYAFIHALPQSADAERVIRPAGAGADPSARPSLMAVGGSMSLYRAGLKLALFLPLGVAMPPSSRAPSGFTDVSSVFSQASRPGATH